MYSTPEPLRLSGLRRTRSQCTASAEPRGPRAPGSRTVPSASRPRSKRRRSTGHRERRVRSPLSANSNGGTCFLLRSEERGTLRSRRRAGSGRSTRLPERPSARVAGQRTALTQPALAPTRPAQARPCLATRHAGNNTTSSPSTTRPSSAGAITHTTSSLATGHLNGTPGWKGPNTRKG